MFVTISGAIYNSFGGSIPHNGTPWPRAFYLQTSHELALCYYKNAADPEVRGWIYLRDMTEIAEDQDTVILTSVVRTLHLYAPTRAEHNMWVTGLAKLCPEAFIKLGREEPKDNLLVRVRPVYCVPYLTIFES